MKQVLCFGDSNTWGYDGESRTRLPWGVRWTSLLQEKLENQDVRVIEEGLCGRTTIFEDPLRDGRKGTALFPTILETHAPVDCIVLMLGTNDCKTIFGASAEVIGKGIVRLLEQAKSYAPQAKILLISPIYLGEQVWKEGYDEEFSQNSVNISKELGAVYAKIAQDYKINFLQAAKHVQCCDADQEHLNKKGHKIFADVVYQSVSAML